MKHQLCFRLNDNPVEVWVEPTETLLDVLRERLMVLSPQARL